MTDDLDKQGPRDANQVNVDQSWEVDYWTKKWGVTEAALKAAVEAAGTQVDAVARQLGKAA